MLSTSRLQRSLQVRRPLDATQQPHPVLPLLASWSESTPKLVPRLPWKVFVPTVLLVLQPSGSPSAAISWMCRRTPLAVGIRSASLLEHDPERWTRVFGKGLPPRKRGSCSTNELKRDDDSKKSHHALVCAGPRTGHRKIRCGKRRCPCEQGTRAISFSSAAYGFDVPARDCWVRAGRVTR